MISRILRLPPVLFFACFAAGSGVQALIPLPLGMPSPRSGMIAAIVMLVAAAAIGGSALSEMKRHHTTVEPGQRPTALVTSGIFSRTRNPLYVMLLLILSATAVMTDSLWLIVFTPLLWIALDRLVVRSEERILDEAFGEDYAAYKRRVRRWI